MHFKEHGQSTIALEKTRRYFARPNRFSDIARWSPPFLLLFLFIGQPGTVWQILSLWNRPHKSTGERDFSLILTLWSPYPGQSSHMITFMRLSAIQRWNKWLLLPHMNISKVTFIFQIKTASRMCLWICWEQSHELDLYSPFLRYPLCRCVQLLGRQLCWRWDTATNPAGPITCFSVRGGGILARKGLVGGAHKQETQ